MADAKDLGAVFDAHTAAEFQTRDIDATMATMGEAPYLTHVPTLAGGQGRDAVRRFYETYFIGHWPEDTEITQVSRTVGATQLVDEVVLSFTHDCPMPAILPGVASTGRKVVLAFVVVVGFDRDGKITHEHIYWDQASLAARADRAARQGQAAGHGRRASVAPARSEPALQHSDPRAGQLGTKAPTTP